MRQRFQFSWYEVDINVGHKWLSRVYCWFLVLFCVVQVGPINITEFKYRCTSDQEALVLYRSLSIFTLYLNYLSLFVDWSEIYVFIFYHFQVGFSFELVVDFGHCSQITLIYWGGRSLQSQMKMNQTWEFDIKNDVQCGATQGWGIVSF